MPYPSNWGPTVAPPFMVKGFEDLAFLFNNADKGSRGIIHMNVDEAACLWRAVKTRPQNSDMVEIGRAEGGSTILMCAANHHDAGRLISIDADPVNDTHLMSVIRPLFGEEAVTLHRGDSQKWDTDGICAGLIFIDGDHTYDGVVADFKNWWPSLMVRGLLVLHDVDDLELMNTGPTDLFPEIINNYPVRLLSSGGSVRVLERLE